MAVSVDSHLPTLLSEAQNIIAGTRTGFGLARNYAWALF
jgi:hypothetical protein